VAIENAAVAEERSTNSLDEVADGGGAQPCGAEAARARPTDHGRGVNAEQFGALLDRLDADRERAWSIYAGVRERLMRFFAEKNCLTAVECADDTLDRAARRLADGAELTVEDPYQYILGIAYNVLREYWKDAERKMVEMDALGSISHPAGDPEDVRRNEEERAERERRLDCLTHCLAEQPPEGRAFLAAYHTGATGAERIEERRRLATEMGIELNALRIRACRARDRIEKCLRACLARSGGGGES
jgi:DNA-directed RNA polymerase specialized sigma24 family protein